MNSRNDTIIDSIVSEGREVGNNQKKFTSIDPQIHEANNNNNKEGPQHPILLSSAKYVLMDGNLLDKEGNYVQLSRSSSMKTTLINKKASEKTQKLKVSSSSSSNEFTGVSFLNSSQEAASLFPVPESTFTATTSKRVSLESDKVKASSKAPIDTLLLSNEKDPNHWGNRIIHNAPLTLLDRNLGAATLTSRNSRRRRANLFLSTERRGDLGRNGSSLMSTSSSFHFIPQGTYIKKAEELRTIQAKSKLKQEKQAMTDEILPQFDGIEKMRPLRPIGEIEMKIGLSNTTIYLPSSSSSSSSSSLASSKIKTITEKNLPGENADQQLLLLGEWWDLEYLQPHHSANAISSIDVKVTSLIQHPIPLRQSIIGSSSEKHEGGGLGEESRQEEVSTSKVIVMPLLLTEKERKKLRTRGRLLREQERQDQIKLGLLPPPPPKLTLKNFMKVHLHEQQQKRGQSSSGVLMEEDATQLEMKVRQQIQDRIKKNQEQMALLKKSGRERYQLLKLKAQKDLQLTGVALAIFAVKRLTQPVLSFRVKAHASSNFITGSLLIFSATTVAADTTINTANTSNLSTNPTSDSANLIIQHDGEKTTLVLDPLPCVFVIAEGGEKHLSKFCHKLETMAWKKEGEDNECRQIWRGNVKQKAFKNFQVNHIHGQLALKEFLSQHQLLHLQSQFPSS